MDARSTGERRWLVARSWSGEKACHAPGYGVQEQRLQNGEHGGHVSLATVLQQQVTVSLQCSAKWQLQH